MSESISNHLPAICCGESRSICGWHTGPHLNVTVLLRETLSGDCGETVGAFYSVDAGGAVGSFGLVGA